MPVLVVECKAENVDVDIRDYYQGESYTRGGLGRLPHSRLRARRGPRFVICDGSPGAALTVHKAGAMVRP